MKKAEQERINQVVERFIEEYKKTIENNEPEKIGRLRSSSATVYQTEDYYILMSYSTIAACVEKTTGNGFDFLRKVYGYTPTSAGHIAKFMHDYGAISVYRYYII